VDQGRGRGPSSFAASLMRHGLISLTETEAPRRGTLMLLWRLLVPTNRSLLLRVKITLSWIKSWDGLIGLYLQTGLDA
jgi:hypothetical protein